MSLELHLGISYVESSNARGIFVEREERCSVCCRMLVHSVILPSSLVQPLCTSIATLWLLYITDGSPKFVLLWGSNLLHLDNRETMCIVVTSMIFNRWSIMVYETKFPRQASTSTVTEDFSEDSEVPRRMQRAGDWSTSLGAHKIGGSGWAPVEQTWAIGVARAAKIWGFKSMKCYGEGWRLGYQSQQP